LNLGERYGLQVGRPANLLILSAPDDYQMIRNQGQVFTSIHAGKVLVQRKPAHLKRFAS
jgi:cytosine deaminase